jgi:hypothetical protein
MAAALKALGAVVLVLGLGAAAVAAITLGGDERFAEVAAAYARHPEHALFQTEYWIAAARHYGLVAAIASGVLGGLALGGILYALGELLRRSARR